MPVPVDLVSVVLGFGLIAVAGAWFGAGSDGALAGLFARPVLDAWPQGVQEGDVPRFAVEHADCLRHPIGSADPFEEFARDPDDTTDLQPTQVSIEIRRAPLHR